MPALFGRESKQEGEAMSREPTQIREKSGLNSMIGQGTEVEGELEVKGTLRVDGQIRGNVKATGMVVVGKDGEVHGDVRAKEVVIGGRILGNVYGETSVQLEEGAHFEGGDIQTRSLIVHSGVFLQGTCNVGEVRSADKGGVPGSVAAAQSGEQLVQPAAEEGSREGGDALTWKERLSDLS